jgi:hypothetical protein
VLAFSDEFNATTLDTSKWNNGGKHQNDVWNDPSNVWLNRGDAVLSLSSRTTGAMLYSGPVDGIGANHYQLPVGGYVEARIRFHSPSADIGSFVPGEWTNAYHVYGAHRRVGAVDFY